MDIAYLEPKNLEELRQIAREASVSGYSRMKKQDLMLALLRDHAEKQGYKLRGGVLEIVDDGIGFLRAEKYLPGPEDIYVSQTQIKRFNLRTGDMVVGQVRAPKTRRNTTVCCASNRSTAEPRRSQEPPEF